MSVRQGICRSPASNAIDVTLARVPWTNGREVLQVAIVGGSSVALSFRGEDGKVVSCDLPSASAAVLAAGRPWRTFRWHRGQAHYSGWYWSATMGRHVIYESRLELARLLLADFDPQVTTIAAQPFFLSASMGGKDRSHVPDFLLVGDDGLVTVVNVKPASRLEDPKVAEALGWAEEVFTERGWRHEIWTGAEPAVLANVVFLAAYRNPCRVDARLVAEVVAALKAPTRLAEIERTWPSSPGDARAAALHLVWRGALLADLLTPLSTDTVLEPAA